MGDGMGLADINVDGSLIKGAFEGLGSFIGAVRSALTGDVSPEKKAELLKQAAEADAALSQVTAQVALAEAQSQDSWTSRARPTFLYVIYIFILFAFPMGILTIFSPVSAQQLTAGVQAWLKAIPESLWALFGAGYLGYGAFRSYDKYKVGMK